MGPHFGYPSGIKFLATANAWETLVDGLTTSQFIIVKPLTSNPGNIQIRDRLLGGVGAGLTLEPTEPPIQLHLGFDNSRYQVSGSADGCSITYMGTSGY